MSIEKRVSAHTGRVTWRVIIWVSGKPAVSQTFSRREDAATFEREQKRRLERGEGLLDVVGSKRTVAWWADRFTDLRGDVAPATAKREDSLLRVHVLPAFGNLPIRLIVRSEVQAWINDLAARRSPSTARLALGVFRSIINVAVQDHALASNPLEGITVRGVKPGTPRALTSDEIAALVHEVGTKRDSALILVLAYLGLRWGEATALVWSDFSADGFLVEVSKAYRLGDRSYVELGPTKTHQRRLVPVPAIVRQHLLDLWALRFGDGSITTEWPDTDAHGQHLVFVSSAGTGLSNQNWRSRVLTPACECVGISPVATPHQLRDSYASLAVAAGVSIAALSANLGHSTPTTTLRHYVGALSADRAQVAVSLNVLAIDAAKRDDASLPLPQMQGGSGEKTADQQQESN